MTRSYSAPARRRALRLHRLSQARPTTEALEARTLLSLTPVAVGEQDDVLGLKIAADFGDSTRPVALATSATPVAGTAGIAITAIGDGVFAGAAASGTQGGPFAAGTSTAINLSLPKPSGSGYGHLTIVATAVGSDGHVIATDRADLFAEYDAGRVWVSSASAGDVQYQRLQSLRDSGAIDQAAYDEGTWAIVNGPRPVVTASPARTVTSFAPALAPTTVDVSGKIEWTDAAGGTHPVPLAPVNIFGSDGKTEKLLTTTPAITLNDGTYSVTVTPDPAFPALFARAYAKSPFDDVKPQVPAGADTYSMSTTAAVATGATITLSKAASNSMAIDNERAFAVDAAMVMVGAYAQNLTGAALPKLDTIFPQIPAPGDSPVSFYDNANNLMNVRDTAWNQLDVTDHEYGHYVAATYHFDASPGGNHGAGRHNIPAKGKDGGLKLAWSEGWATYFSISGQDASNASTLMIPSYGDHSYNGLRSYSLDTLAATGNATGEDDEGSVMGVLWNMYLTSKDPTSPIQYTDKTIFDLIKSATPKTLGDFWEAAASKLDLKKQTQLGKIFGDLNVAPVATDPADNTVVKAGDPIPTFKWHSNGAGAGNPLDEFKVVFYSADFSTKIFESPVGEVTVGATDSSFTPTPDEYRTIQAGGSQVRWFVEGKSKSAPSTPGGAIGYYESESRLLGVPATIAFVIDVTGSMSQEIAGVRIALQLYIDLVQATLPAGVDAPTIELVSFRDAPMVNIVSNDLNAVRAAVATLGASGGGDCPEPSAAALQVAAADIGAGGTILLATDASSDPGIDLSAVIGAVRAKGVSVNVLLSGDCSGIDSLDGGGDAGPSLRAALATPSSDEDTDCDCDCNGTGDDPAETWVTSVAGPAAATPSSDTAPPTGTSPSEPDGPGADPPRGSNNVTPVPPIDDLIGHSLASATRLALGGSAVRGLVGITDGVVDDFVVGLTAGRRYAFRVNVEQGTAPLVEVLGPDGTTVLASHQFLRTLESGQTLNNYVIGVDAATSGDYYVRVTGSSGSTSFYTLRAYDDPLADVTSSIVGFSSVAYQTGGAFLVRDSVKSGDRDGYVSALFNTLSSTLGPAVLSSVPATAPQGQTITLTLTGRGTNWRPDRTLVAFPDGGVTVQSVNVTSPTTLSVVVHVDDAAALGARDVVVGTDLGSRIETSRGRGVIQVTDPVTDPTLLGIDLGTLSRGQTADLILRGANTAWDSTSTVTLGPGVTVNSVSVISPTQIRVNVTVAPDATIAFRTARVTTGADSVSLERALFVNIGALAIPQVVTVSPSSLNQGRTSDVAIVGANTSFLAGQTTVDFGPGVTVSSVTVADATHLTARVTVALGATVGFRDVVVTTNGQSAVLLRGFFVDVPGSLPTLVSASPTQVVRGGQVDVTIRGSNTSFLAGTTTVDFGAGTQVVSLQVLDPTTLVATILVDATAATGSRDVTVRTGAEVLTLPSALTVLASDAARIVAISPSLVPRGAQADVTVFVTNLPLDVASTTADFGAGVHVLSLRVLDASTLVATLAVDSDTLPGARDVTIRSGGLSATLPGGFSVSATVIADPQLTDLSRLGVHMMPTSLVATFNTAMDPASTSLASNYAVLDLGVNGRRDPAKARVIQISSATYDAATNSVSLVTKQHLALRHRFALIIRADATGVHSASGVALDGAKNGQPGTTSITTFGSEILDVAGTQALARRLKHVRTATKVVRGGSVPKPSGFAAARHGKRSH